MKYCFDSMLYVLKIVIQTVLIIIKSMRDI